MPVNQATCNYYCIALDKNVPEYFVDDLIHAIDEFHRTLTNGARGNSDVLTSPCDSSLETPHKELHLAS